MFNTNNAKYPGPKYPLSLTKNQVFGSIEFKKKYFRISVVLVIRFLDLSFQFVSCLFELKQYISYFKKKFELDNFTKKNIPMEQF